MKRGLVIGKFYPPHKGHKYLIDTALANVDRLTVIVCQAEGEVIPGNLRAQWIKQIHPQAEVMLIDDHYDQENSKLWADLTKSWLGYVPDVVFTSEDYGHTYAQFLETEHVLVDKPRKTFPISGTAVRKNPFDNWEFLEPVVRAFFARRICVVGAESTGTTTLSMDLAKHYSTCWVPEFGRTYWEGKLYSRDTTWQTEEFEFIATEQNKIEDKLAQYANKILICDTNSWATALWHERYMGNRSKRVESLSQDRKYDLYILTDIDIPFVQDGTRDGKHIREKMHKRFKQLLIENKVPFIKVSGSKEKRIEEATKMINSLFSAKEEV